MLPICWDKSLWISFDGEDLDMILLVDAFLSSDLLIIHCELHVWCCSFFIDLSLKEHVNISTLNASGGSLIVLIFELFLIEDLKDFQSFAWKCCLLYFPQQLFLLICWTMYILVVFVGRLRSYQFILRWTTVFFFFLKLQHDGFHYIWASWQLYLCGFMWLMILCIPTHMKFCLSELVTVRCAIGKVRIVVLKIIPA